jgi:hypothetical protein
MNAFMHEDLPLSNQLHGIHHMTPPELLHTMSEGSNKYMIESLHNTIGDVGDGKKFLTKIENLHHTLHFDLKGNSEHEFPRGSARNGALKNTLVSATERHGNMFLLLCLCHTDTICKYLKKNFINPELTVPTFSSVSNYTYQWRSGSTRII